MKRIASKLADILGLSLTEMETLLNEAISSSNPQEQLLDLLGIENIEYIEQILHKTEPQKRVVPQEMIQRNNIQKTVPIQSAEAEIDRLLAPNIKRISTEVYEEYMIEAVDTVKPQGTVPVTEIDPEYRKVFQEYTHFNTVQSIVFPRVYQSNDNILISAPTGAGKTDIALLSIVKHLQETRHNRKSTSFRDQKTDKIDKTDKIEKETKERYKAIYLAPMKALATEVTNKFKSRLQNIATVREYTGDTEVPLEELKRTDVLICTPEKFDISTRQLCSYLIQSTALIVIDEIHLLNESRGTVLECIVARFNLITEQSQRRVRMIGISATLPNPIDVSLFLGVSPQNTFTFSKEYRPVPIQYSVIGTKKKVDINVLGEYMKRLDTREKMIYVLKERVNRVLEQDQQVIVFVHSRKETLNIANELGEEIEPVHMLEESLPEILREMYSREIFVHHAGLPRELREFAETKFKEKRIKVLVSTSTLAWGVNLPARAVIIFGTTFYSLEKGMEDISTLDVQQMFGRAGRPQFDTQAEGTLITDHLSLAKYVRMLRAEDPIESTLMKVLPEKICTEIYLRNIRSHWEGIQWIKHTFLWVRMNKFPERYGTTKKDLKSALADYTELTFNRLRNLDLLHPEETRVTELGRILVHYSLTEKTILSWNTLLEEKCTDILRYFSETEELQNIVVREDERKGLGLGRSNEEITRELKVKILLEKYIKKKQLKGYSLGIDQRYILENTERLLQALTLYLRYKHRIDLGYRTLCLKKEIDRAQVPYSFSSRHIHLQNTLSLITQANTPSYLSLSELFSGLILFRRQGKVNRIEEVFDIKYYYLVNIPQRIESIVKIEEKMINTGRIEVLPLRVFSENEIWLVDRTLTKILGYSLELTEESEYLEGIPETEIETECIPQFKQPERYTLIPIPPLMKAESNRLLLLQVYEQILHLNKNKNERILIVLPTHSQANAYTEEIQRLSLINNVFFEKNTLCLSTANGIVSPRQSQLQDYTVCITTLSDLKLVSKSKVTTVIFPRFKSKDNSLLYPSTLTLFPFSNITIYERENELKYIEQAYIQSVLDTEDRLDRLDID
ncbi:activating signal cointegrator complex subunit 3 [Nematocida sp. AWRm80]|nr:activating signal cointegrator complex subunit 3 [Nematocida sp. AWRm80]